MSWQQYVDKLVASKKIDKAAIFSAAGDSVWAATPDFSVKPEEVKKLSAAFKDPSDIQASGLHIASVKNVVVKADDRSIYGKKEKTGVCCVATKLAIIVAHYDENTQAGEAAKEVEQLADYLIKVGY